MLQIQLTYKRRGYCYSFLSWVSAASGNTISSANLLFLLLVFYQQQDSQEIAALTSLQLTGTISAAVLGNSTFFWYQAVALNRASANQALTLSIVFLDLLPGRRGIGKRLLEQNCRYTFGYWY
jgi:hypothetical protein